MADEIVELGINGSANRTGEPKCSKCVNPFEVSENFRDWFSGGTLIRDLGVVTSIAASVSLIALIVALGVGVWAWVLILFTGIMSWVIASYFTRTLHIAYEQGTGKPHFHLKPPSPFLEVREDLPNGEQTVRKIEWLEAPILRLPLGGRFRKPAFLGWLTDGRLFPREGPWQFCSGSCGVENVALSNRHGDRVSIPTHWITEPFDEKTRAHVLHILLGKVGKDDSRAVAAFVNAERHLAAVESAGEALDKTRADRDAREEQLDRLGTTVVRVVDQLRQSKGERKSRPAEIAREALESGLSTLPPELVTTWREEASRLRADVLRALKGGKL